MNNMFLLVAFAALIGIAHKAIADCPYHMGLQKNGQKSHDIKTKELEETEVIAPDFDDDDEDEIRTAVEPITDMPDINDFDDEDELLIDEEDD